MTTTHFEVPIEGQRVKKNQVTAIHLMAGLLLLVIGAITWAVPGSLKAENNLLLNSVGILYMVFGIGLLFICIFLNKRFIQSRSNFILRIVEIFLFLPILIYSIIQKWYLPAAYAAVALLSIIFAYYWEKKGEQIKLAIINENGVRLPLNGNIRQLDWSNINKLMMRHNILTVDCTNNKLIQLNIQKHDNKKEESPAVEQFSAAQIVLHKNKATEDW